MGFSIQIISWVESSLDPIEAQTFNFCQTSNTKSVYFVVSTPGGMI